MGKGAFGKVLKIKRKSDNRVLALKVPSKDFETLSEKDQLYEKNEARILSMINHPFVVKVIDEIEYQVKKCFIMELAEGGSLQMLIEERKKNS